MVIATESEYRIRLHSGDEPSFSFDIGAGAGLSPFHLLAASLATCTYSVLHTWAHQAELSIHGLEIVVEWDFGGDPYRVTEMRMELRWPGLPAERRNAARLVAAHCTVHHTLQIGSEVETRVATNGT